ncbi:MAG: hypothetical protein ACK50J_11330 [Planctomyces sp.]
MTSTFPGTTSKSDSTVRRISIEYATQLAEGKSLCDGTPNSSATGIAEAFSNPEETMSRGGAAW